MNVLALDVGGIPRQWLSFEQAIMYHAKGQVAWALGDTIVKFHGGTQSDGAESYLESSSIIAIRGGEGFNPAKLGKVVLSNKALFGRDRHICAYCGNHFTSNNLSRDHIIPVSRGGDNVWMNVVTACKSCNSRKSNKTLKEANLELLYIPYEPNHYENMILQNRSILADQMDYLKTGLPKHSRVLQN
jgi:hypothetical protein